MDDQLDNDLKNHIREVFENFEDTSADEGWLLLREKFPEKRRRRPVAWLWWGSVAAMLLLLLGILWFEYTPVTKQHLAISKKQPVNNSIPNTAPNKKDQVLADSAALHNENQALAEIEHSGPANKKSTATSGKQPDQTLTGNVRHTNPVLKNQGEQSNKQPVTPALNNQNQATNDISKGLIVSNQAKNPSIIAPQTGNKINADTGSKLPGKSLAAVTNPGVNMLQQVAKAKKQPFADDDSQSTKTEKKTKNTDQTVRFGVYAATYFNYAKGSSNQLNLGAGVTSDIKLSKNLSLSTGVAIAQNTLNYQNQNQLPQSAAALVQANYLVAPNTASTKDLASYTNASYTNAYVAGPSIRNYNASLVGLDIPVNLKFVFDQEKSDTYISAGLSSGTFINETYTYSYSNPAPFSANVSQVQDQSTHQSFNSFYFAKTLNFSFGTGYSLGHNRLIVEPFLKYPLDGLGSQQIRFGAGGLNLKFNFQAHKK
ncbi:MAG: hypothetical protein JWP37_1492 [Mucilaginibacter sp.]|nr:hypothetical protein [Mucilaginibacter sp.]